MMFKLALWGTLVFFDKGSSFSFAVVTLISVVHLWFQAKFEPYKRQFENMLMHLGLAVVSSMCISGLVLNNLKVGLEFARVSHDLDLVEQLEGQVEGFKIVVEVFVYGMITVMAARLILKSVGKVTWCAKKVEKNTRATRRSISMGTVPVARALTRRASWVSVRSSSRSSITSLKSLSPQTSRTRTESGSSLAGSRIPRVPSSSDGSTLGSVAGDRDLPAESKWIDNGGGGARDAAWQKQNDWFMHNPMMNNHSPTRSPLNGALEPSPLLDRLPARLVEEGEGEDEDDGAIRSRSAAAGSGSGNVGAAGGDEMKWNDNPMRSPSLSSRQLQRINSRPLRARSTMPEADDDGGGIGGGGGGSKNGLLRSTSMHGLPTAGPVGNDYKAYDRGVAATGAAGETEHKCLASGRRYLVNPVTGEKRWAEDDASSATGHRVGRPSLVVAKSGGQFGSAFFDRYESHDDSGDGKGDEDGGDDEPRRQPSL